VDNQNQSDNDTLMHFYF